MAVSGALASFAVLVGTKVVVGGERWVFYHHAGAVAVAEFLLLRTSKSPVLPYLDLLAAGLLFLLACGRIGCLLVGCCHGRPADWGVCYGPEHVSAGFPRDLGGVRLAPVQLVEALWVVVVASMASGMVWNASRPGAALSWCLIGYGGGRFLIEFWRGDRDRPTRLGMSEAQWTSLLLVLLAAISQAANWLPSSPWQFVVVVGWGAAASAILFQRSRRPLLYRLLRPNHVQELTRAMDRVNADERLCVEHTSLGLRISSARFTGPEAPHCAYTLSNADREMDTVTVATLAQLMRRLRHPADSVEVIAGQPGVFHVVVHRPL
jgi:hypothetical protein